jgi:hypothetical protein
MCGLSNLQLMLIRYLNCPELMDLMEERAGVNSAEAAIDTSSHAWFETHSICVFCLHVGKCRYWLEGSDTRSTPADFCSYSEFFRSCTKHSSTVADVSSYDDDERTSTNRPQQPEP